MACSGKVPENGGIMVKTKAIHHRLSIMAVGLFLILLCTVTANAADCSSGCSCLLPADAKEKGYSPCGGQLSICGYDNYQNAMYCYNSGLTVVLRTVSPLSVITTAQPATCPDGCSCLMESAAKEKFGIYTRCSETPCNTVVTGSVALNAYCFRQGTTPTPVTCPQGCDCISEATAKAKGGIFTRCSADICGYELSTATLAAAVQMPKYCMKPELTTTTQTPVCPESCSCISDDDAKLKGMVRCDSSQTPCDYRSVAATANTAATRIPLYCYKTGITTTAAPQVCPEGCWCLQEAEAALKFGSGNYARCSEKICGYDKSAASANVIPQYCFKPTNIVTVTPAIATCPQGCICITDEIAKAKELAYCRGERTSCGYDANKMPQYCFEQVPSTTCVYDYQKNTCSGTCQQGYTCGVVASSKDASGKVDYAICGCTGQQACVYDAEKNACTGTCINGNSCLVVGKETDKQTGKETAVCGCPQSTCIYDYRTSTCTGSCAATGDNCQLNTIYRDQETGKVTYAECHCKGAKDVTPTPAYQTCSCDPARGGCIGTCSEGQTCWMTEMITDSTGKVSCAACNCKEICSLAPDGSCTGGCPDGSPCILQTYTDPASGVSKSGCGCGGTLPASEETPVKSQAPDIFTAIGNFFKSLFGLK